MCSVHGIWMAETTLYVEKKTKKQKKKQKKNKKRVYIRILELELNSSSIT